MTEVFLTALLISFLGQLPFGNMNLTATQLAVQEGYKYAWRYGIGIVIVEVIYLRLALTAMDWVVTHKLIFTIMGWLTVAVFLALGILSLRMAKKQSPEKKGLLLNNRMNRFFLGVSVSAINPAQIPFWFIWSTNLINSGILKTNFTHYNLFTGGAAIGSVAGLAVYIYGGKWVIEKMKASNKQLNTFMGIVFILVALYQLYIMLFKHSVINN
ncbi:MAG: LysE family transporter [Sphingobacteriales bacterium]|nr:LysE family transporter [Sphingobacteriales bacterium]